MNATNITSLKVEPKVQEIKLNSTPMLSLPSGIPSQCRGQVITLNSSNGFKIPGQASPAYMGNSAQERIRTGD